MILPNKRFGIQKNFHAQNPEKLVFEAGIMAEQLERNCSNFLTLPKTGYFYHFSEILKNEARIATLIIWSKDPKSPKNHQN